MASFTDLSKLSSTTDYRPIMKAKPVPVLTSRKFVEPFARLKNRANLFRRKNYSSHSDISNPRSSLPADHFIPTDQLPSTDHPNITLKRSNSMICPQQRLQTFLKTTNRSQRNSICVQLSGCPTDDSSTDDYRFLKSSSNRYWNKKMSNITEQDVFPSDESLHEKKIEPEPILSNEKDVTKDEQSELNLKRRQSFDACKQGTMSIKSLDHSSSKISACTMTGKSLNNLDECLSTASSEDKGVQTNFNESIATNCSTSLSSSSTSIQTDSLENKPKIEQISKHSCQLKFNDKWPHLLREGQTCIYWVNYLGSTAIKITNDNTSTLPISAIHRLKQSTQYARVLPIIGLSISLRGVEFLKHTKERIVICFHDMKSIHCACQDEDLRYFAYVTREQRAINGITSTSIEPPPAFTSEEYHNYCHVFVVKNQTMSTEILLNFGQAFDMAYRLHQRVNSKQMYVDQPVRRHSKKSKKIISLGTSSSSSSSINEQRVFV